MFCVPFLHVLTTHTSTAKDLTRNHDWSVCFGKENFADPGENRAKHLHNAYLKSNLVFALWLVFCKD